MRKHLSIALAALLLFGACQKNSTSKTESESDEPLPVISQRACATNEVLQEQLAANPGLQNRMNEIETFTKRLIAKKDFRTMAGTTINIPVVIHVLYKTRAENISDAQIQSQIDVLNEDFNKANDDRSNTPTIFQNLVADVNVTFSLSKVIRKATNKKSWSTNDAMKKSSQGGSDPVDASNYLNIWVCNLGQGLLGYAQFPGGSPATDGVVVLYSAFGRTGTLMQTYNKGRTATHEVGHWMNLRHIWGDQTCGSDLVDDTPNHNTANYGCPSYPQRSTCAGTPIEMTMNFMDYTNDACMYMFTNGQSDRMFAAFAAGGPRAGFN
ncbi:MAG TPA: zinc metalloprotease [Chitinophagaceae bacterium]|nr:zinc metalloprotease [Chitinophagaceae bacterium]